MVGHFYVCGSLLLLLARPSTPQEVSKECVKPGPWFEDAPYPYLYRKFETALIKNRTVLDNIRALFITGKDMDYTTFAIKFEVDHGENVSCAADISPNKAFCNSDSADYIWKLCPLDGDGNFQFVLFMASLNVQTPLLLLWLGSLHGNLLQLAMDMQEYIEESHLSFTDGYYYDDFGLIYLTLKIEELNCNPSFSFVKCVLSELLSWVSHIASCI